MSLENIQGLQKIFQNKNSSTQVNSLLNFTVKPVYNGHTMQQTLCNSRHLFVEPAKSWSNSYGKTPI